MNDDCHLNTTLFTLFMGYLSIFHIEISPTVSYKVKKREVLRLRSQK